MKIINDKKNNILNKNAEKFFALNYLFKNLSNYR